MRGLLFEGLAVSSARNRRRPWVAVVSFGLHAAVGAGLVLVPLLSADPPAVTTHTTPISCKWPVAPVVTLPPKPPEVRTLTPVRRTSAAPAVQSIPVSINVPDTIPTSDPLPVDADATMTIGEACPECAPAEPGTPAGGGDPSAESGTGPALVEVGGDIQAPRKVKHVAPVYPPLALQIHLSGMVIVECVIDTDGRVTSARVLRGHPLLDAAAMRAVEQWVYEPTRLNGQPVAVQMTVTVRFTTR